jgi:deoxyribonuclease V
MALHNLHAWDVDPQEASTIQAGLREKLTLEWDDRDIHHVGGVDIGLTGTSARAAIVVLRFPDLAPLESVTAEAPLVFPYIPGFLAFREGPAFLAAWEKLSLLPDLLMFDGQGIAHPRGVGIASQMGLWIDQPTIGVAKSRLYGSHAEPGPNPGDYVDMVDPRDPSRLIGAVLRTRAKVKPLFVSPGHLIDIAHAIQFVTACLGGYRLPEPTRLAHRAAGGEKIA